MNDKQKAALAEGSTYLLSLNKILGKKIVDVYGYVTTEFGDPTFQMSQLVLEDGTTFFCEGEHDLPYLTDGSAQLPNLEELKDE